MRIIMAAACCVIPLLAGCGSIVRGTTEAVSIYSTPEGAKIKTDNGHECDTSCTFKVARRETFTVTVSKPGYRTEEVYVDTVVSAGGAAAMSGNVLLGGVVGAGVDVATGAGLDHSPNPVRVDLQPLGSAPKRARGKNSAAKGTPTS
ncbi:PEGA domain-containing protein [Acuticoccus sp. MNP-M23]|uniref:PEGA domain-containing protein n=1 Tax=Acuticoccus sp. MNP-M23 TaxID=3072793 RepID=UPI002816571C|nr:PEGA domain-containing protein [Acuticoccus sp. MNP-M23]WMS43873.1 PEGA domain-containing protein [Acuticoccus sp. MNP-M23]